MENCVNRFHCNKRSLTSVLSYRNNDRSTENVRTDWGFDRSNFCLAGNVYRSRLMVMNMTEKIKVSMLFSCFSSYQYVASRCVLRNFGLKSWVKCN